MIPKAELHVHLEGTAPPDLIRRLAERNDMPVPDGVFDTPERFAYTDFLDFLRTYDLAASVIRTGDDYRDVTYEYLAGCARDGALYVELTASPDHAALVGLSDEEHLDGIARGIDDARAEFGIEGRVLISCVRNFGVDQALRVARYAAELPHPYVVGFSMAGDEENFPAADYAEPFEIAAAAGLGCTVHAGEWAGADSVRAALELPVTRIGHGVRAIEDAALVERAGRARDRARVLPHQQRGPGRVPELRGPSAAAPAGGRREGDARIRRSALLRRLDRRRVRGLRRALRLRRRAAARDHQDRSRSRILRRNAQESLNPERYSRGCRLAAVHRGRLLVSKTFRLLVLALVAAFALGMVACGSDDDDSGDGGGGGGGAADKPAIKAGRRHGHRRAQRPLLQRPRQQGPQGRARPSSGSRRAC